MTAWAALLGVTTALVSALAGGWWTRKRTPAEIDKLSAEAAHIAAEADQTAAETWRELAVDLRKELADMKGLLAEHERTILALRTRVAQLEAEARHRAINPLLDGADDIDGGP